MRAVAVTRRRMLRPLTADQNIAQRVNRAIVSVVEWEGLALVKQYRKSNEHVLEQLNHSRSDRPYTTSRCFICAKEASRIHDY